jgi:hypothetical protein
MRRLGGCTDREPPRLGEARSGARSARLGSVAAEEDGERRQRAREERGQRRAPRAACIEPRIVGLPARGSARRATPPCRAAHHGKQRRASRNWLRASCQPRAEPGTPSAYRSEAGRLVAAARRATLAIGPIEPICTRRGGLCGSQHIHSRYSVHRNIHRHAPCCAACRSAVAAVHAAMCAWPHHSRSQSASPGEERGARLNANRRPRRTIGARRRRATTGDRFRRGHGASRGWAGAKTARRLCVVAAAAVPRREHTVGSGAAPASVIVRKHDGSHSRNAHESTRM